jgi:hypothetical protein
MRLRACIAGLLIIGTGCAALPETVRIEVDGKMLELRQQGLSGRFEGGWSKSPDCGSEPRFDAAELGASVESIRMITADELELLGRDGSVVRLFRCR